MKRKKKLKYLTNKKHTPGPWKWAGEDYRGGWGWMKLVGPSGEGIIIGEGPDGRPDSRLLAHVAADPALCGTGMIAAKNSFRSVCVAGEHNARLIVASPELLAACKAVLGPFKDACKIIAPHRNPATYPLIKQLAAAIAKAEGGTR